MNPTKMLLVIAILVVALLVMGCDRGNDRYYGSSQGYSGQQQQQGAAPAPAAGGCGFATPDAALPAMNSPDFA